MSRLTSACCKECEMFGENPDTDEEVLSEEEVESADFSVEEITLPKTSHEIKSERFWRKGIKWLAVHTAGLNHRLNYFFNE